MHGFEQLKSSRKTSQRVLSLSQIQIRPSHTGFVNRLSITVVQNPHYLPGLNEISDRPLMIFSGLIVPTKTKRRQWELHHPKRTNSAIAHAKPVKSYRLFVGLPQGPPFR